MTSKFSIDNRELLQRISCGEAVVGIDFGNLIVRELAVFRRAAMDSKPVAVVRYVDAGFKRPAIHVSVYDTSLPDGTELFTLPQPAPEYPETLPCPVLLEPGLRFGKGIKTSTMLAALARRAVHESDMAALSPEEIAEFQARIEDFKALIAQPAPVVPGWIPVSELMPENKPGSYEYLVFETLNNRVNHDYWNVPDKGDDAFAPFWNYYGGHVTHWMPLPASPQEVKGE